MSIELPIPTLSGSLSFYGASGYAVARLTLDGNLTGAFPSVLTAPTTADCILEVVTPAGVAQVTIPQGSTAPSAPVGFTLSYAAGDLVEIRIVQDGGARDLSGYISAASSQSAPAGLTLCSVADVKAFMKIEDSTSDAILDTLCNAVSEQIERWLGWRILPATYTERYDGGASSIQVRHGPIEDLGTVTVSEYGTAVDAAELELLDGGWTIGRFINEYPAGFAAGMDSLKVTYTGGYAITPPDFNLAATMQTAYVWRQSGYGNNLLGIARRAESGGVSTAEYQLDPILPKVESMLRPYRSPF